MFKNKNSVNERWTSEETRASLKKIAEKQVKIQNSKELEMMKEGMIKILVDHPTVPRCKVERWVKA